MLLKELFKGIGCYFKAMRVISKYKLWPYMTLPGIMSLCYVFMLIILGSVWFSDFALYINENMIPDFMQGGFMQVVVAVILWLLLIITGYITYKEVVLIFFSPVLSLISERVEKLLYNQPPPVFKIKDLITDILRGLHISLRNLLYMLSLTLAAWLTAFIPLIGTIASPVLIIIVQSYYGGIGLVDYTLERKRYSVSKSLEFARSNRGRMTGVGAGFFLLLFVPVLGWFAAPGLGTVAATIAALEKINENDTALLDI